MTTTRQTRRTVRRIDENAPPVAPTTRTRSAAAGKAAVTASSIPIAKRSATTSNVPAPTKSDAPVKKPAAGKTATAAKGKALAVKEERKPLGNQAIQAAPARRPRVAVAEQKVAKVEAREERVAPKRKAPTVGPSTVRTKEPAASTSRTVKALREKAVKEEEVAPVPKRRRTSTPPPAEEYEDAHYDEDGQEIVLSSGGTRHRARSPVLRAKDDGWTDLDGEDEGDPAMVSEYVVDAFKYMMSIEVSYNQSFSFCHLTSLDGPADNAQESCMPEPDYMDNQAELQWKMRGILMDWLIEVHLKFRLLPETLFIATNLIDRFLSLRVISLVKFQLVGLTALFIASKYEEVICPSITHFLHMTKDGYDVDEILKAERYMLSTLDFDLSYPNPLHFLRRVSKADNYDIQTRTVAKYLIEISCVDYKMMEFSPSCLAAASMWLARFCLDRGEWVSTSLSNLFCQSAHRIARLARR
jgi:hypothetical protein